MKTADAADSREQSQKESAQIRPICQIRGLLCDSVRKLRFRQRRADGV